MSRRPEKTPFSQQKLTAFSPKLSINGYIVEFFVIGMLFLPFGIMLRSESNHIQTFTKIYDSSTKMDVDCAISEANVNGNCTIAFEFDEDVPGPIFVYYELTNFYQNNRRYLKSTSTRQLLGEDLTYDEVSSSCYPLVENGTQLLNPCGLIANSFFNDVITLEASPSNSEMFQDEITWPSDLANKFNQVDGFVYALVVDKSLSCIEVLGAAYSDCGTYVLRQNTYYYWYPNNDNVQYLYESYPDIVNPIEGVKNEHFVNWMRTSSLPKFRKLYGRIDAGVSAGSSMIFTVRTNFEVKSFGGTKSLVVTTLADYGGKNYALGNSVIIMGSVSLFIGIAFALRRLISPRPFGDIRHLNWK